MRRSAYTMVVGISGLKAEPAASVAAIPDQQTKSVMDKDDEKLMAEYANGDMAAFKVLYERYETPVYRFAYNGCRNEADARELFQDVWLRVVRARRSFNPEHPFKAWLFTIARNRLTDGYRQQANRSGTNPLDQNLHLHSNPDSVSQSNQQSAIEDLWAPSLTPEQIASASEQSDTLQIALHKLPEQQREAIVLKHIAGMDLKEIAAVQAEGVETVKSRLRYAMVKLRQHLKELP